MWHVFQIAIGAAVVVSNIEFGWTGNGYVVALCAVVAVVAAQIFINSLIGLSDGAKMLLASARNLLLPVKLDERVHEGRPPGIYGAAGRQGLVRQIPLDGAGHGGASHGAGDSETSGNSRRRS
jgi:hypothetical protein